MERRGTTARSSVILRPDRAKQTDQPKLAWAAAGELRLHQEAFHEERSPRSLYSLAFTNLNRLCQQTDFAGGLTDQLYGLRDQAFVENHRSWRSGSLQSEHHHAQRFHQVAVQ